MFKLFKSKPQEVLQPTEYVLFLEGLFSDHSLWKPGVEAIEKYPFDILLYSNLPKSFIKKHGKKKIKEITQKYYTIVHIPTGTELWICNIDYELNWMNNSFSPIPKEFRPQLFQVLFENVLLHLDYKLKVDEKTNQIEKDLVTMNIIRGNYE